MKQYGETFRQIREQKGYTMRQIADGILSVSFLSKFERGESDISLTYITRLLEKLSMSFEEFFYLHDGVGPEQLEYFFDKADESYVQRDLNQLRELRKIALEKWETYGLEAFRCNTLMLDVYESIIQGELVDSNDDAIDALYHYLFHVEVWGYYELRLYNSTMLLMPMEMVMTLSKTALEKSNHFGKLQKNDHIMIRTLLNTLNYLSAGPTLHEEAYKGFLDFLENTNIPQSDLYSRNMLLNIKGIHAIRTGYREKGIDMVKKAIYIFSQLGSKELAVTSENYLQLVLDR